MAATNQTEGLAVSSATTRMLEPLRPSRWFGQDNREHTAVNWQCPETAETRAEEIFLPQEGMQDGSRGGREYNVWKERSLLKCVACRGRGGARQRQLPGGVAKSCIRARTHTHATPHHSIYRIMPAIISVAT